MSHNIYRDLADGFIDSLIDILDEVFKMVRPWYVEPEQEERSKP